MSNNIELSTEQQSRPMTPSEASDMLLGYHILHFQSLSLYSLSLRGRGASLYSYGQIAPSAEERERRENDRQAKRKWKRRKRKTRKKRKQSRNVKPLSRAKPYQKMVSLPAFTSRHPSTASCIHTLPPCTSHTSTCSRSLY